MRRQQQDIKDMQALLTADEQFLMTFEEKCQIRDEEWEEHQKTLQLEIDAKPKAIAIMNGDDDHELFPGNSNPSLLQRSSTTHSERQTQAIIVCSGW